jgi:hypothetical protein
MAQPLILRPFVLCWPLDPTGAPLSSYPVCPFCGALLAQHGPSYECPTQAYDQFGNVSHYVAPWFDVPYDASDPSKWIVLEYTPKPLPVGARNCRKCKNQSLREVTMPGDEQPVAFCKYCGETEAI